MADDVQPTGGDFLQAGVWKNNPILVQVLGMCPTLAVTNSVENALVMGAAATFVLLGSNVMTSLLRRQLLPHVRILVFTLIIAAFVTIADLVLQAYLPAASKKLGPFVPLIIVNCIIIARCEVCAVKNSLGPAIGDALGQGIGFTGALTLLGTVRELLGNGTFLGHRVLWSSWENWVVMILPAGAFIALGIMIGAANYVRQRKTEGRP